MERSHVLDAMGQLKLYGMKAAYDEVIATAVKRQHDPQQVIGDLLNAEISEKQARSIKYQMTIAKLPLAKELDEFDFEPYAHQRDARPGSGRRETSWIISATWS
jgi:DNA replication protein DnaC